MISQKLNGRPEDACECYDVCQNIANHETDAGDLCDDCFEQIFGERGLE